MTHVPCTWLECEKLGQDGDSYVSRLSRGKALPTRHSRNTVVSICPDSLHSSHVLSTCFTLQEGYSQATCENSLNFNLPWVFTLSLHTTHTMKFHIKYRVQKIEQNYNQIWHEIKANKTHNCKLQLYRVDFTTPWVLYT